MIHRRQKQRTPPPHRRRGSYCRATRSLPRSEIVAESKITQPKISRLVADHQGELSIKLVLEPKIRRYVRSRSGHVVAIVGRNGVHPQPWCHGLNKAGSQLEVGARRRGRAKVPDGNEHVALRARTPQVIAPADSERGSTTGGRGDEADHRVPFPTELVTYSSVP